MLSFCDGCKARFQKRKNRGKLSYKPDISRYKGYVWGLQGVGSRCHSGESSKKMKDELETEDLPYIPIMAT